MYFNQSKAKFGLIKDIKGQIFLNYKYKCNSSVKGSFLKKMVMLISFESQPHPLCKVKFGFRLVKIHQFIPLYTVLMPYK